MFTHIVQRANGKMVYLYIRLCTLVKEHLLLNAKNLLAKFFQASQAVVNHLNQVAQTLSTIKASLANHTTQAPSTKVEPKSVLQTSGQNGQQPVTTAPPTLQPVKPQRITKPRHAERTKLGRFAPKGTGVAPTHTETQLQKDGKSSKTVAKQLRQHATNRSMKGR